MEKLVKKTNESTIKLPLMYEDVMNFFQRSDQVVFHRKGIPAVFLTIDDHKDYHRPTDDAERIHYGNTTDIAKLLYEITQALGNAKEGFLNRQ